MITSIKNIALSLLNSGAVYSPLRRRAHKHSPLTILCYHTLRPDHENIDAWIALRVSDFRAQVHLLQESYDIVSIDDALNNSADTDRPKAVITFDDGELGLFSYLLPFINEMEVPVTVYIATEQIQSGNPYWFDRVMNALQAPGLTKISLPVESGRTWEVGPERGKQRWAVISNILETLKGVDPKVRQELTGQLVSQTENSDETFTQLTPMSIPQLKELSTSPFITIGAHSHCHNLLDQIPLGQAEISIRKSQELLEMWTGKKVEHFAYPNGNHSKQLQDTLGKIGFKSATILDMELTENTENKFALSRLGIGRYDSLGRFRLRLVNV